MLYPMCRTILDLGRSKPHTHNPRVVCQRPSPSNFPTGFPPGPANAMAKQPLPKCHWMKILILPDGTKTQWELVWAQSGITKRLLVKYVASHHVASWTADSCCLMDMANNEPCFSYHTSVYRTSPGWWSKHYRTQTHILQSITAACLDVHSRPYSLSAAYRCSLRKKFILLARLWSLQFPAGYKYTKAFSLSRDKRDLRK